VFQLSDYCSLSQICAPLPLGPSMLGVFLSDENFASFDLQLFRVVSGLVLKSSINRFAFKTICKIDNIL